MITYIRELSLFRVTIITTVCKFSDVLYDIEELPKLLNGIVSSIESVPEFRLRVWIKKSWLVSEVSTNFGITFVARCSL